VAAIVVALHHNVRERDTVRTKISRDRLNGRLATGAGSGVGIGVVLEAECPQWRHRRSARHRGELFHNSPRRGANEQEVVHDWIRAVDTEFARLS
jgi:hypothetical protein